MNSSFRNSNLGFLLYALIIFMISTVLVLITWYMLIGYRNGTFSENTIIGSVYLGGLREEDVDAKVNERVDIWLDDPTIVFELTYQGYTYEFDRTLFDFDVQLSKDILVDGTHNELIVKYQTSSDGNDRNDRLMVHNEIYNLPYLEEVKDNIDIETLINDVLSDAGYMKTFSSKAVEEYLIVPEDSYVVLDSIIVELSDGMHAVNILSGIEDVYGDHYIDLDSNELFDIQVQLGSELTDQILTILSRGMLKLAHETNFNIHDVNYIPKYTTDGHTADTFYFGYNTYIDRDNDYTFSLYNPNNSIYSYLIEDNGDDTLTISLVGLPFVNTITVPDPIVKEPIPFVVYEQDEGPYVDGQLGYVVSVVRTITDIDGFVVSEKEIVFEFYNSSAAIIPTTVPE